MGYHSERFQDFSLMVYNSDKLVALLPANRNKEILYSHQGLSYGGLVVSELVTFESFYTIWKVVLVFLEEEHIQKFQLKLLPRIYQTVTNDEIDYLLFKLKAKNYRKDITSVIDYKNLLSITSSNRKRGVKKGIKNKLEIKEDDNFEGFWNEILIPNLAQTHQTKPVHTVEEIKLLKHNFPNNIRQFNVYHHSKIVGGVTIFETENVAHAQYISANMDKQQLGTLDFLFSYLIKEVFVEKKYFDFGISNENQGHSINRGLLNWKESFGARSVIHDFYEIDVVNHVLLNDLFI